MQLVNKKGIQAWVPMHHRDHSAINSFNKWEQAFRVYSNVLTEKYPHKSAELIQYNHVINTAAQSIIWDNVYKYDKDFRRHISKFPTRSWTIILHQAWMMRLKDRMNSDRGYGRSNTNDQRNKMRRENCRKFNVGKCTYGLSCKFEHRCALCLKSGHGAHNCRRVKGATDNNERWSDSKNEFRRKNNFNDRYHFNRRDREKEGDGKEK